MIGYRRQVFVWGFLAPALMVVLFLGVYPAIRMVYTSLTDYTLTCPWKGQPFNYGRNYATLFLDSRFWLAAERTAILTTVSVGITLALGFGIASLVNRLDRGRFVYRIAFLVPMVVAPSIAGLLFKFILNYDFGFVNQLLAIFRIPKVDFLGTSTVAFMSVIAIDLWQWTPFAVLVLLAGLESLPREQFEAARIDGASAPRMLWHITLPLMRRYIVIVGVFRFVQCIRLFDTVKLLTDGGPGTGTEVLNVYITKVGFAWFDMGYASALAFVALNLAALLGMLFIRSSRSFT